MQIILKYTMFFDLLISPVNSLEFYIFEHAMETLLKEILEF